MAEVLLFHHAQGLTAGVLAFADELGAAGHVVHTPDLFEGRTFADVHDGVAFAREVGFGTILERGRLAAEGLPNELVYAGSSRGTSTPPARSSRRSRARSCSCTRATGTCSPTAACPTTTRAPRRCSCSACSPSSKPSEEGFLRGNRARGGGIRSRPPRPGWGRRSGWRRAPRGGRRGLRGGAPRPRAERRPPRPPIARLAPRSRPAAATCARRWRATPAPGAGRAARATAGTAAPPRRLVEGGSTRTRTGPRPRRRTRRTDG